MCGILCHVVPSGTNLPRGGMDIAAAMERDIEGKSSCTNEDHVFDDLVPKIVARGSNYCSFKSEAFSQGGGFEMFSSVLSLRAPFTPQPRTEEFSRWIVQFNGELYNDELDHDGEHYNDTEYIFESLERLGDVFKVVEKLEGEFAYCILDKLEQKVYFGKDILGKKALAYSVKANGELYVSSVHPTCQCRSNFEECVNAKVYVWDRQSAHLEVLAHTDHPEIPKPFLVKEDVPDMLSDDVVKAVHKKLSHAIKKRIETIFALDETNSAFAILYSGGIDCTLIAAIIAETCPPGTQIDLLNVSFFNPRTGVEPGSTPDRLLALKGWSELQRRYPATTFNFVEEDVSYEEYLAHKEKVVNLIYPNNTEMDLSIAIALYFAARGKGKRVVGESREPYCSDCKVLISGLGADELFGGYTRHERIYTGVSQRTKKALKQDTEPEVSQTELQSLKKDLREELQGELDNIYRRNLTRDDKVMSCWSKEVRFPFLDTGVISLACDHVSLDLKLNFNEDTGEITRKLVLRLLAARLELDWVVNEPKRAIQFGARSAKMEKGTGRMKGTDRIS
ncbi:unnamed protein product [Kuraishia capsulata CBS 1993]|uniref:Glutamine amidotransferase type-2 domain-containing protein n=1 Tax=Kuraishia capsulata CBS 1993 TaxID=1382522 RepID=W6MQN1_9ASCO|nr:uncharacterized protein KUCA_T00004637001 [Kuraishia capsulata CBS 1993]CDK28653.1 unnamed protein product [Kuraishia capsulata CBS 1993]